MQSFLELLNDYESPNSRDGDHHSILREYVDKMSFADMVKDAGAEYISHDKLETTISSNRTGDLYILYFNKAAQDSHLWNE
jgi:hypothetical protein